MDIGASFGATRASYNRTLYGLMISCVLVVFSSVLFADFVRYDDQINVTANPYLLSGPGNSLTTIWTEPYAGLYIPVTYSAWAGIAWLSDLLFRTPSVPGLFHFFNLLLHIFNTLLVYEILKQVIRRPTPSPGNDTAPGRHTQTAAVFGAMIFAVHPIQVEAVAWVTGLKDVLSGFFSLWAILLFLKMAQKTGSGRRPFLFAALISFLAALLSKPSSVVVPAMILLLASGPKSRGNTGLFIRVLPLIALSAVFIFLTQTVQHAPRGSSNTAPGFYNTLLIAGDSILFYIRKIIFPDYFIIDYGKTPETILAGGTGLFSLAVIAVILAVCLKNRAWFVSFTVFIVGLSPTLGFIPYGFQAISNVADRYAYLAMIGISLMSAAAVSGIRYRHLLPVLILPVLFLGVKTAAQARYWESPHALMGHTLAKNPASRTAHLNYGIARLKKGDANGAAFHCRIAMKLDPSDLKAYYNLALALAMQGNFSAAEQQAEFLRKKNPAMAEKLNAAMTFIQTKTASPHETQDQTPH